MNKTIERLKLANFGNLELLAKQVVEGFITGLHKSPFHGFSVEFAEHRLYNSGESTRHIDWKLFARSEKLFTKKYEEETNLRCQLVIDCSSSMLFPQHQEVSKLEFAIYAAASIIELLKRQRDAVGLSLFTDKLDLHTQAKSSVAHHRYLYSELEKHLRVYQENTRKETNSIQALHDIAELCHKRSLVVVFTDLIDDPERETAFFQALQHLKHNKHEVIVFHVVDKKTEIDFELENRPYTLVDMETGERLKLQPAAMKQKYTESVQQYFSALQLKFARYKIDFMPADIAAGYDQVLLEYLLKRQKMY
jgi:uncharacterized protein (DUF58 family)